VDIRYKPFDASKWAIEDGGMKGKIYFTNRWVNLFQRSQKPYTI
jgi:hypothetical protein